MPRHVAYNYVVLTIGYLLTAMPDAIAICRFVYYPLAVALFHLKRQIPYDHTINRTTTTERIRIMIGGLEGSI